MDYYTPSRAGSGSSRMQMIPHNSLRRSSTSQWSYSNSPSKSYYGDDSPRSSAGSFRSSQTTPTEISTMSTQTMGSPQRTGYAPGQAPAAYFNDYAVRRKWDALTQSRQGRGLPPPSRVEDGYYQSPRSPTGRSWREDDEMSIVPEDSISNVGSIRSGDGGAVRQYYSSASRVSRLSDRERAYAPSGAMRSGFGDARTQVANGRRVREVAPL